MGEKGPQRGPQELQDHPLSHRSHPSIPRNDIQKSSCGHKLRVPQPKKRDGSKHARERLNRVYGDSLEQFFHATV